MEPPTKSISSDICFELLVFVPSVKSPAVRFASPASSSGSYIEPAFIFMLKTTVGIERLSCRSRTIPFFRTTRFGASSAVTVFKKDIFKNNIIIRVKRILSFFIYCPFPFCFTGMSMPTVLFFSVKYVFATRIISSFVTLLILST